VRVATLHIIATAVIALGACTDVRDFRGSWRGPRVGTSPAVTLGLSADAQATVDISSIDTHGIAGTLSVDGLVANYGFASLQGAEADVLSGTTFAGSPLRVYMAFVATTDGGGDAFAVLAIYEDRHVEVRLLRAGPSPVYAIFTLTES
jgi:hypothetical protein